MNLAIMVMDLWRASSGTNGLLTQVTRTGKLQRTSSQLTSYLFIFDTIVLVKVTLINIVVKFFTYCGGVIIGDQLKKARRKSTANIG